MQKIELSNGQYRLLLQLVALGTTIIDDAVLGDDSEEDEDEESEEMDLLEDALELENDLMHHCKKFGVKDVVETYVDDDGDDYLDYTESFQKATFEIASAAYFNKTLELASFQLGLRDFKEANGLVSNEELTDFLTDPEDVLPFTAKYTNEIFENGFERMAIRDNDQPARIISLSE